ncbi:MAG TPA: tagatose 1,6-diphosphate aldolase [Gemmataceae bacterium]|nr:tagatose 1,6-diphosphate aldolase [Gemmataceae bacterium]
MSDRKGLVSVTRLLGLNLSPGKLRGLQSISNPNGTLTMVALDQNSSMISMIKDSLKRRGEAREPTFDEIVEAKVMLARALAPRASAVLVDAYYGAWNTVASFSLPRDVGLLVRVEKSGGNKNARGAPLGEIEPGWGVGKIKRMGADAVKLLAQFEPTEPQSAEHQFALVQQVYDDCQKHDILMLLETVAFPFDGEKKDSKSFMERKASTVLESARRLSRFCDIYKAEFPGNLGKESDAQLKDNLHKLNDVSERPWVLLSAGVDFPDYKKQVEMAVQAGASGVLGGRAFWKEYFLQEGPQARDKFARQEAADRVRQIDEIVKKSATPWYTWYGLTLEELADIRATENWHFRYGERRTGSSGPGTVAEGEVY